MGSFLAVTGDGGYTFALQDPFDTLHNAGGLPGAGRGCAFSPDGNYLAAAHWSGNCLTVIDTSTWAAVSGTPSLSGTGWGCAFSPDGNYLAVAHDNGNRLTVIDTSNWTAISGTPSLPGNGYGCAFSPDLTLPARRVITYDHDGNRIPANIKIVRPGSWRFVAQTFTGLDGEGVLRPFTAEGGLLAALVDNREDVREYDIKPIEMGSEDDPPVELYLGYAGEQVTMSGNVTTSSGVPAAEVVIRAWASRKLVARVYPASDGSWSADVPPGRYDVTYLNEGCQPITHGPYHVEV